MIRRSLLVLAVAASAACGHARVVLDVPRPPPPQEQRRGPSTPDVLEVKEVRAEVVSARVIYAKDVKAREGRIGRIVEWKGFERGHADGELKVPEVVVDTIHAKEIHADYLEADVVYAKEVKIGR